MQEIHADFCKLCEFPKLLTKHFIWKFYLISFYIW